MLACLLFGFLDAIIDPPAGTPLPKWGRCRPSFLAKASAYILKPSSTAPPASSAGLITPPRRRRVPYVKERLMSTRSCFERRLSDGQGPNAPYSRIFPWAAGAGDRRWAASNSGCNSRTPRFPEGWCGPRTRALGHYVMAAGGRNHRDRRGGPRRWIALPRAEACRQRTGRVCRAETKLHLCDANGGGRNADQWPKSCPAWFPGRRPQMKQATRQAGGTSL